MMLEKAIEYKIAIASSAYWRAYYSEEDTQNAEEVVWFWREVRDYYLHNHHSRMVANPSS